MILSNPKSHLLGLDGLRGVAALVVVFLHGTLMFKTGYLPPPAALAVDFFFLMSGYVISYAYDERLVGGGLSWFEFIKLRTIRLYPMIFVGTTISGIATILAELQKHIFDPLTFLLVMAASLVLLPVGLLFGTNAYPLDNPAWSLFFEFFVNAMYGTRIGLLGIRKLAALAAFSAAALIIVEIRGIPLTMIGWSNPPSSFLLGFVRVAYPFLAGVLLHRTAFPLKMPKLAIGLIGGVLAFVLLLPIENLIYNLLLVLVVFPTLVALGSCARIGDRTARLCNTLGQLSYPLYLIHWPVYELVRGISFVLRLGAPSYLMLIVGAALSVLAAELILIYFDEPTREWLKAHLVTRQDSVALHRE